MEPAHDQRGRQDEAGADLGDSVSASAGVSVIGWNRMPKGWPYFARYVLIFFTAISRCKAHTDFETTVDQGLRHSVNPLTLTLNR